MDLHTVRPVNGLVFSVSDGCVSEICPVYPEENFDEVWNSRAARSKKDQRLEEDQRFHNISPVDEMTLKYGHIVPDTEALVGAQPYPPLMTRQKRGRRSRHKVVGPGKI